MDLFHQAGEPSLPIKISEKINYKYTLDDKNKTFTITIPNGKLIFSEFYFPDKICKRCIEYFQENDIYHDDLTDWASINEGDFKKIKFKNINWKQDKITIFGKTTPLPRLTSWYGDPDKDYSYSGIKSNPNHWNKGLLFIKKEIEKLTLLPFNSALLNWYRNGEDYLNWHSDDEKELGENPVIASANFGATRDFVLRRIDDPEKKITIPLKNGSLLIMGGELQHYWQHSVPKRKKIKESRFNITFRCIKNSGLST